MHRMIPRLGFGLTSLLFIGIFPALLNAAEVEEPTVEELQRTHTVYVEPQDEVVVTEAGQEFAPKPYRERRGNWGVQVGLNYSTYEPVHYITNFADATYASVYKTPVFPLIEGNVQVKRNLNFGSLGVDFSAGQFRNSNSPSDAVPSTLNMGIFSAALTFNFDTLFREPYVVPYVQGGAYMVIFNETLATQAYSGNTTPAPFVVAGAAFQLDWIDKHSALVSYQDTRIQSTFIFVEARQYMASSSSSDPDFGNDLSYSAGLKMEF